MGLRKFCEQFVVLKGKPISFAGRGYLDGVYSATGRNLILRCSRQVEKSTLLCNRILFEACTNPGIQMIFICPRLEQVGVFSKSRLLPMIENSPLIRRALIGEDKHRLQVRNLQFRNGSELFLRAAFHSADPARGLSGDLLFIDEFQDIASGSLPVLQETLSHSSCPRVILTATPKAQDNHVETVFQQSTGREWQVPCVNCRQAFRLDEKVIGAQGLACPTCQQPLMADQGQWVARNPQATWGDGYWINHLMVPWLSFDKILEKQATYDAARFKNECLGLPTALGDHVITREEIEACCSPQPMAAQWSEVRAEGRDCLIAGVDWGGGGTSATVVTIGYIRADKTFVVVRIEQLRAKEEPDDVLEAVAKVCRNFRVRYIGADGGGNGSVYNRLLLGKLGATIPVYAIYYSATDQEPTPDGVLYKWVVNRTSAIGSLFSRIKKRLTLFPRVADCGHFLDQFTCEIAAYDEHQRTVQYTCPENQNDDALHSLNYAQLVALKLWHVQHQYDG
jgi:hypothetical protein